MIKINPPLTNTERGVIFSGVLTLSISVTTVVKLVLMNAAAVILRNRFEKRW